MKRTYEDVETGVDLFTVLPRELQREILILSGRPALGVLSKEWFDLVIHGEIDWFEVFSREAKWYNSNGLLLLRPDGSLENTLIRDYIVEMSALLEGRTLKLRSRMGLFLKRALTVHLNLVKASDVTFLSMDIMFQTALYYMRDATTKPLSLENFHPRDFRINFFEEGHTYFLALCDPCSEKTRLATNVKISSEENARLGGVLQKYLISVTTLLHEVFAPFEEDRVIERMMKGKGWNDPTQNLRYFGLSVEGIKAKWQEARDLGTAMHANIENYYNGLPYETGSREWDLFTAFEKEFVHGKLEPFRTEWLMWCEELRMTGSADMIFRYTDVEKRKPDANGKIHVWLMDWKRAIDLLKPNPWQQGTKPCTQDMEDCKISHYSLQLMLYAHFLQTYHNVVVDGMSIVGLHPSQETRIKYDVVWEEKRLQELLAHRKECLLSLN
jgi:hypothetical protein